jgi:hypothetical protein
MRDPIVPITGLVGGDSDALYVTLPLMQSIFVRSELNEGEKLLWLWCVIHCALTQCTSCEFSYLELANMMHWKVDAIHRALHRLEALGYFQNKIPFLHGVVTFAESLVKRTFNPTLPEHEDLLIRETEINLIRDELRAEAKEKEAKNKETPDIRRASTISRSDLHHVAAGCKDNPSCYSVSWTEMLRCILDSLKTDNVPVLRSLLGEVGWSG